MACSPARNGRRAWPLNSIVSGQLAKIEQLHERLLAAASLLDQASGEIRDIPLQPSSDNVLHIGAALTEIFDILRAIYAVRPDLEPPQLETPPDQSAANKRLTIALGEALRLAGDGRLADAASLLEEFCRSETSQFHRRIAKDELQRLRTRTDR
jgi:hypothetical protein